MRNARIESPRVRFSILICLAAAALSGCATERKIQLPEDYGVPRANDRPPVIEVEALVKNGTADKPFVTSPSQTSPEVVAITSDSGETGGIVSLTGLARHQDRGIRYFRLRISRKGEVIQEYIANQFPDADNKVFPTLGIIGSDGSGGVGVSQPIRFIQTYEKTTVSAFALAFGWASQTLEILYTCPVCKPSPPGSAVGGAPPAREGQGGSTGGSVWAPGTGTGTGSGSGGGTPPPPKPIDGDFVEVDPDIRAVDETLASPDSKYSARIANGFGPLPQSAILKFGNQTKAIGFAVGSLTPLLPEIGGVAFDQHSSRAVVATFNKPNMGVAEHVSYQIAKLPGFFSGGNVGAISVYELDPAAGGSTQYVRPRLFFSPDSTLALALAAPVAGTSSSLYSLVAYDLRGSVPTKIGSPLNVSQEFSKAAVVGSKIKVTLIGPVGTPVEFTIP